jgi:signal transduction histidine kinase
MVLFKPLLRNRSLRLVVGLAVAVAIPAGVLIAAQYRSIRDLERTSVVVLETLSTQVADTLREALRHQFEKPSFQVERIDHFAIEQLELEKVVATLRQRAPSVPLVDAFYLWSKRGEDRYGVLEMVNRPSAPETLQFEPAGSESGRLLELARELAGYRLPWGTSVVQLDGREQALVIHLLFDSSARERLTSLIAFRVDLDRFRSTVLPDMLEPLMSTANRQTSLATLVAEVVDRDGRAIYRSAAQPLRVLEQRKLPLVFFAPDIMPTRDPCDGCVPEWHLRVGYAEGSAASIAYASTRGYRTLLASLVALLAFGIVLAGRMALKEMQLAEAKSHFVASVSHELKTPLALIQLFAETLELGRVRSAERAREYYAIINAEARKLAALIDNVLDFSRTESGLGMYRLLPVDLGQVVRHIVSGFEAQFAHQGFEVHLDVAEVIAPVLADEEAVGLAVANLLSNAMKYSGTSREILVSVFPADRGVAVRVEDRGIGIPRRHHRRIFRKFYRVGEGADAPRGCGLGLAIVDHVMRAHRGRVTLESEPGRGSTFTLVFPTLAERQRDETDSRDRRRAPDAVGAA